MKKIFACAFLLVSTVCISQKLETAKDLFKQNKIVEAKKEIDLILQDPQNQQNADAWYTKAKIYNGIAALSSPGTEITGAREAAFKALIKYTELDEKMLISLQIDGYKPINDIYTGFYQSAANSFNNKNYEKALEGFKKAIEVSSFMTKKGWIKLALDTNSVLYAGVAAEKLQKPHEAVN
jgi:tetratricopeptide (TPR) repeat protein